ncbi:MAG: hypothetical protein V1724_03330 [Chloroflexota bacterium]
MVIAEVSGPSKVNQSEADARVQEAVKATKALLEEKANSGNLLHIADVLGHFSRERITDRVSVDFTDEGNICTLGWKGQFLTYKVFTEPRTGKRFIFDAFLPDMLSADTEEVNPRHLIPDRLLKQVMAFAGGETRFQNSIGRMVPHGSKYVLALFDGSHGAAADLFAGNDKLFCKIYLPGQLTTPEALHWNNHAHSELRQQEFRGQVLSVRRSTALDGRWRAFMDDPRFPVKSERFFINQYVNPLERKGMKAALFEQVVNGALIATIVEEDGSGREVSRDSCRMKRFVDLREQSRRAARGQVSYSLLQTTLFDEFVSRDLTGYDYATSKADSDPRARETKSLLRLLNLLAAQSMEGRLDAQGDSPKETLVRTSAEAMWKKGAARYWVVELKKAIVLMTGIVGDDMDRIFQLNLSDEVWRNISEAIQRIKNYEAWADADTRELLNANTLDTTKDAIAGWAQRNEAEVLDAYFLAGKPRPSMMG